MAPVIVIGLGNPGEDYRRTRHNAGFRLLDRLAERGGVRFRNQRELGGVAWTAVARLGERDVVLAKPRTYMNRSGRSATALCRFYGAEPTELLVAHDDADLEFGRLRVRRGGGAGGHNGVRSLIDGLGVSDFTRVRLGVRGADRDQSDLADYVLSDFTAEESALMEELTGVAADAVECLLREGLEATMNRYNATRVARANGSNSG